MFPGYFANYITWWSHLYHRVPWIVWCRVWMPQTRTTFDVSSPTRPARSACLTDSTLCNSYRHVGSSKVWRYVSEDMQQGLFIRNFSGHKFCIYTSWINNTHQDKNINFCIVWINTLVCVLKNITYLQKINCFGFLTTCIMCNVVEFPT